LGMIEVFLEENIEVVNYYVLDPKNACSGTLPVSIRDRTWQYRTNEIKDPIEIQDGVAPQCAVSGLTNDQRVFIPKDWKPKGFTDSHSIGNYKWIFEIKNVNSPLGKGYVKERK